MVELEPVQKREANFNWGKGKGKEREWEATARYGRREEGAKKEEKRRVRVVGWEE